MDDGPINPLWKIFFALCRGSFMETAGIADLVPDTSRKKARAGQGHDHRFAPRSRRRCLVAPRGRLPGIAVGLLSIQGGCSERNHRTIPAGVTVTYKPDDPTVMEPGATNFALTRHQHHLRCHRSGRRGDTALFIVPFGHEDGPIDATRLAWCENWYTVPGKGA